MSELTAEQLKDRLYYKRKNGRLVSSDETLNKADEYCEGYKSFLNKAKTEREAVKAATQIAKANGFSEDVYKRQVIKCAALNHYFFA